MKWKQWKMGLLIAMFSGVMQAMIQVTIGLTWKQVGVLTCFNVGQAAMLYLKTHPEDSINFDTTITTKTSVVQSTVKTPSITPTDGTQPTENK
jgi:hypothetical protein